MGVKSTAQIAGSGRGGGGKYLNIHFTGQYLRKLIYADLSTGFRMH